MRKKMERFFYQNRKKGIPNLMLYLVLGTAVVYLSSAIGRNYVLYDLLCFDRDSILHGQVWRLLTYPLTFDAGGLLFTAISLLCYYSIGRAMENIWGTCKLDIYCLLFGGQADVYYLNMGLFLSYATLYPDAQFLLMFIIPVRAWIFALLDLVLIIYGLFVYSFPANLFPVVALANYFLFFGKDVLNVIPMSWRANARRLFRKKPSKKSAPKAKPIPFPSAGSYEATVAQPKAPYTHKCTVCGRTDVSNPELEFRYCSKCRGYYCYCQDHINNHVHIQ